MQGRAMTALIAVCALMTLLSCAMCLTVDRRSLARIRTKMSIVPSETDEIDRHGNRITGPFYVTGDQLRAWHGSDARLEVENLGSRALWLGAWSTNSLAAAMKKAFEGQVYTDGAAANKHIYLHLFEIAHSMTLINLQADATANRNVLRDVMGEDPGSTMGNPSKDEKKGYDLATIIHRSHLCDAPNCGWRSAWDQDEFMICPRCQESLQLKAVFQCNVKAIVKRLGVPYGQCFVAKHEIKDSEIATLDNEVKNFPQAIRELQKLKKAKDTGKLKTFDMELKGSVGILDLLKKTDEEEASPCTVLTDHGW